MENNDGTQEVTLSIPEIYEVCRHDMNLFAAICTPGSFLFRFPRVFESIWQWLLKYVDEERAFNKLAVGLPRGFAKTSVLKLFIAHSVFYSNRQYILIIGATVDKAVRILSAVADILDEPKVRQVFGDRQQGIIFDRVDEKYFWMNGRKVYLQAVGACGSIRGTNVGDNARPDLIIFDDIQELEDSDSEVQWNSLKSWFQNTALKTRSPFGCMYVVLGNVYPTKYSMFKWLIENPDWLKYITGAITADGESIWEELFPLKQLLKDYESDLNAGEPESFFAELMNDPNARKANKIDYDKLPKCPFQDVHAHTGNFIIIDPSGNKGNSDNVSIGYVTIHDCTPVLTEVVEGQMSPGDTIKETLKMCLRHNCTLVISEGNGYQETLLYWFQQICAAQGIDGITFLPEYSGMIAKSTRIATALQAWAKGELFVSDACETAVKMQVKDWDPTRRNNTDGLLDLLVYAIRIAAKYAEYFAAQTYQVINNTEHARITHDSQNSPV